MRVSLRVRRFLCGRGLAIIGAGLSMALVPVSAIAVSNNNSMVVNTTTAYAPQLCTGRTKIDTCMKMVGSVGIVAGVGTPSLYSIDELAFIRDSVPVGGVSPSSFTGVGTASAGTPSNSTSLMCYVLDVDAGAAGTYNFSCEMSSLSCNKLYRYHFAGSHTTGGSAEHSNTNATATSMYGYSTPCAPPSSATVTPTQTTASISLTVPNGALAQTMSFEYGASAAYGTTVAPTSGGTIAAAGSGTGTTVVDLSGLTCNTTYHYRFSSTTNDGAVNGSTTTNGADQTFTTSSCAVNAVCGAAAGSTTVFAPTAGLCSPGTAGTVTSSAGNWGWTCAGSSGGTNATCTAPLSSTSTNTGLAGAVLTGGTWTVAASGNGPLQSAGLIPLTGHPKSPAVSPPSGYSFPHGLLDFVLTGGVAGSTATLTITYPTALPAGTVYMKYGRTPTSGGASVWYPFSGAVIAGNTVTLTLTDGALGDDDLAANGLIVDPGGPAIPPGSTLAVPTLSEWALILLAGLLVLLSRRRLSI